uniref:Uncharacterized protein n=1 Tax=Desertifilum tharense IPPAS B-1220 TaxID=1781255 RepID=A0A1E5QH80_9CYAN|nr:hypothetical protein BH720_16610 [Desertifilum tharense IPPAS B-1220]
MLYTNNITDLFKEFFREFFHRVIFRIFLDNMTIGYVIPKVSGYHRKIYGKFLDNILCGGIIQKVSVFCPLGIDYPENVGIISSYAAQSLVRMYIKAVSWKSALRVLPEKT